MRLLEAVSKVLAFRAVPTTILLVLIYGIIFSTVLITDELPNVPKNQRGLNLDQAYLDLHKVRKLFSS